MALPDHPSQGAHSCRKSLLSPKQNYSKYSKIFKSKFAAILNLSNDHIERHRTLTNYVKAKFKLVQKQDKHHFAFLKKNDRLIQKELRLNRFKSKIVKVNTKKNIPFLKKIKNNYFLTENNKENLVFIIEISKKLKLINLDFADSYNSLFALRKKAIF